MTNNASEWSDHNEWFERGPLARFVRETRPLGDAEAVMLYTADQPAGDMSDPAAESTYLARVHSTTPGVYDFGGGLRKRVAVPGDIAVVPPRFATRFMLDKPHTVSTLVLPVEWIGRMVGDSPVDFGQVHEVFQRDPGLGALFTLIEEANTRTERAQRLYQDSLLVAMLRRLAALAGRRADDAATLAPVVLARVIERIEAHLSEPLTLTALATVARMTPSTFHRAFLAATGRTPHAFVIERRLERAKAQLAGTSTSIADIAYDVGFSSQAHMTSAFTRRLGVTPARYRRGSRT